MSEASRRLERLATADLGDGMRRRGVVAEVGDGVARVVGLADVGYEHLVHFDTGALGMAFDIDERDAGVVLLTGAQAIAAGEGCSARGKLPSVCVGAELLGRVVDPLGGALDGSPPPTGELRPVFLPAPELIARVPVDRPLITGLLVIDAAVPIGRGQRQLIVGDRNVGKTALALDIVAAQKHSGVLAVYVLTGQPISRVMAIRTALEEAGALDHTVVVAADASATPGLQYLAPYAGATVAEYFRDRGRDVVIVFDDLTKHADAYRELALLLGRPPGREAFPGDIFYIHAELLERATALAPRLGGGSVTAFPLVETTDSDIAAYIPTNLISITDGQIYLDRGRFERNLRPAVDIGRSVSRIGGAAQSKVMRAAAKNVRIDAARFESLEALTRVGLDVDARTRRDISRGRILRELLRQPRFTRRRVAHQVMALSAVSQGWLDAWPPAEAARVLWSGVAQAEAEDPDLMDRLDADDAPEQYLERLQRFVRRAEEEGGDGEAGA